MASVTIALAPHPPWLANTSPNATPASAAGETPAGGDSYPAAARLTASGKRIEPLPDLPADGAAEPGDDAQPPQALAGFMSRSANLGPAQTRGGSVRDSETEAEAMERQHAAALAEVNCKLDASLKLLEARGAEIESTVFWRDC